MGLGINITIDPPDGMPERVLIILDRVGGGAKPVFARFGQTMRGNVDSAFRKKGYPAGCWPDSQRSSEDAGSPLHDTGRLRSSIEFRHDESGMSYGTSDKRAAILFTGGVIKPKRAKALTIPLTKEAAKHKASDFEDTFVAKGVIFQERGKKIIPLYVLKKSVTMPERKFPVPLAADIRELANDLVKHYGGGS